MKLKCLLEYDRYRVGLFPSPESVAETRSPAAAYDYAIRHEGRFSILEPIILQKPDIAIEYAKDVIGKRGWRWPEAEPTFLKKAWMAYEYARYVIKDRWPEAEPIIMVNPELAFYYAKHVIKGRWPEAERFIFDDPYYKDVYINQCVEDFERGGDIPVIINYTAIVDLPNNITNKQLRRVLELLFNDPRVSELIDKMIEYRAADEEWMIKGLKNKSFDKITLDQLQKMSNEQKVTALLNDDLNFYLDIESDFE